MHRKSLTCLRISAHKLPVELGRYAGISRIDRTCTKCDSGSSVGDEYHFFMECQDPLLTSMRQQLFSDIKNYNSQFGLLSKECLFTYLLLCQDKYVSQKIALYVNSMLSIAET